MAMILIVGGILAILLGFRAPLVGVMIVPCGVVAILAGIAVHSLHNRIDKLEAQVQALHAAAMSAVDELQEDVEAQKESGEGML